MEELYKKMLSVGGKTQAEWMRYFKECEEEHKKRKNMKQEKVQYELLKDLPSSFKIDGTLITAKAGQTSIQKVFTECSLFQFGRYIFEPQEIEANPEWFKKVDTDEKKEFTEKDVNSFAYFIFKHDSDLSRKPISQWFEIWKKDVYEK